MAWISYCVALFDRINQPCPSGAHVIMWPTMLLNVGWSTAVGWSIAAGVCDARQVSVFRKVLSKYLAHLCGEGGASLGILGHADDQVGDIGLKFFTNLIVQTNQDTTPETFFENVRRYQLFWTHQISKTTKTIHVWCPVGVGHFDFVWVLEWWDIKK